MYSELETEQLCDEKIVAVTIRRNSAALSKLQKQERVV
jgi:hypothetical protein